MNHWAMRLTSIEIEGFKNVDKGYIDFNGNRYSDQCCVCGIYGPNGSGKTAVVNALELLRKAMQGVAIDKSFLYLINLNNDYSLLKYTFKYEDEEGIFSIEYETKKYPFFPARYDRGGGSRGSRGHPFWLDYYRPSYQETGKADFRICSHREVRLP